MSKNYITKFLAFTRLEPLLLALPYKPQLSKLNPHSAETVHLLHLIDRFSLCGLKHALLSCGFLVCAVLYIVLCLYSLNSTCAWNIKIERVLTTMDFTCTRCCRLPGCSVWAVNSMSFVWLHHFHQQRLKTMLRVVACCAMTPLWCAWSPRGNPFDGRAKSNAEIRGVRSDTS